MNPRLTVGTFAIVASLCVLSYYVGTQTAQPAVITLDPDRAIVAETLRVADTQPVEVP